MEGIEKSPVLAGTHDLRNYWRWLMGFGVITAVLGLIAISSASAVPYALVRLFGVLLLGSGAVQLAHGLRNWRWGGYMMPLALSALYLIPGILMVSKPIVGVVALTLVVSVFFFMAGAFRLAAGLTSPFPSSPWVVLNGVVDVLFGVLLWTQTPIVGLWAIGVYTGIEMLFAGLQLAMLGVAARRMTAAGGETIRLAA